MRFTAFRLPSSNCSVLLRVTFHDSALHLVARTLARIATKSQLEHALNKFHFDSSSPLLLSPVFRTGFVFPPIDFQCAEKAGLFRRKVSRRGKRKYAAKRRHVRLGGGCAAPETSRGRFPPLNYVHPLIKESTHDRLESSSVCRPEIASGTPASTSKGCRYFRR